MEGASEVEPRPAVLGVDVGGTFTDLYLDAGERVLVDKLLSTPHDYAEAVLEGATRVLTRARNERVIAEGQPVILRHGSTVATNAFLERRGGRVALLVTEGFEDLLEIGRQDRPALYDLDCTRPPALVEREDCFGVPERIGPGGEVLRPLTEADADRLMQAIAARGIDHVAICLLYSFANDAHERLLVQAAKEHGLQPFRSSDVLPEMREVERATSTAICAYVHAPVAAYLERLESEIAGAGVDRLQIFGSHGAVMTPRAACERPIDLLLSGPAGGVVGAHALITQAGIPSVLTYDMGGTSTDVALCEGEPLLTHEGTLAGLPVHTPRLDIETVGAGGGSIGWVDPGGALRVGPRSAGAFPGPACYGRGGEEATVTDANVVLGRLPAEHFLGGEMPLDTERAREAVSTVADKLGISLEEAAREIIDVANVAMARALRRVSVERGHDLKDTWLLSFGGAGGLHAAELARFVGQSHVVVPPNPGILSAAGIATARPQAFASLSVLLPAPRAPEEAERVDRELATAFLELERRVHRALDDQGLPRASQVLRRTADLRYRRQSHELEIEAGEAGGAGAHSRDLAARFEALHEERFGYRAPDEEIELVTVRVRGGQPAPTPESRTMTMSLGGGDQARIGERQTWFDGSAHRTPLFARGRLRKGDTVDGPAIIVEPHATTLVPPGMQLIVDATMSLLIEVEP